eukprot:83461_1
MFSEWVDSCKSSILQSSEWNKVSDELHKILSDRLSRDCVGFFADLTHTEQLAYIKQIKQHDLKDTKIYDNFLVKMKELIEKYTLMEIEKLEKLNQSNNAIDLTRLDKILHITSEGTAKLLKDFPQNEIQNQLSNLSNVSLSPNLRKEIWKLLLHSNVNHNNNNNELNTDEQSVNTARSTDTFSIHHNNTSPLNNTFQITEKCENILLTLSQIIEIPNVHVMQKTQGFGNLNTLLPLMKTVMIKYHKDIGYFNNINHENTTLCDERYFYFIIPILVTITDFLINSITNK